MASFNKLLVNFFFSTCSWWKKYKPVWQRVYKRSSLAWPFKSPDSAISLARHSSLWNQPAATGVTWLCEQDPQQVMNITNFSAGCYFLLYLQYHLKVKKSNGKNYYHFLSSFNKLHKKEKCKITCTYFGNKMQKTAPTENSYCIWFRELSQLNIIKTYIFKGIKLLIMTKAYRTWLCNCGYKLFMKDLSWLKIKVFL